MKSWLILVGCLFVVIMFMGCSLIGGSGLLLILDKVIQLIVGMLVFLFILVVGVLIIGVIYFYYDLLVLNWEIEELWFNEDIYCFLLKMKCYYIGGVGELMQVLKC